MTFARLAIAAVLVAVLFAGCGGDGQPNYMDTGTLETQLRKTANDRMADDPAQYGEGTHVTSINCVEGSEPRMFKCGGATSDGERYTTTITVSKDGSKYVSVPN